MLRKHVIQRKPMRVKYHVVDGLAIPLNPKGIMLVDQIKVGQRVQRRPKHVPMAYRTNQSIELALRKALRAI